MNPQKGDLVSVIGRKTEGIVKQVQDSVVLIEIEGQKELVTVATNRVTIIRRKI